jgi:hypothetical protein
MLDQVTGIRAGLHPSTATSLATVAATRSATHITHRLCVLPPSQGSHVFDSGRTSYYTLYGNL